MSALLAIMSVVLVLNTEAALPVGFTTFFNRRSCPDGWRELDEVKGRVIVSVTDHSSVGVTVNQPLGDRQDVTHRHNWGTSVSIATKEIAAIASGDNAGAAKGSYPITATSQEGTSGYPFTQMLLCSYHSGNNTGDVAFGSVAYFNPDVSKCPTGWREAHDTAGRILIPGYEEGGAVRNNALPLSSGEDRKHNHTFDFSIPLSEVSFEGVAGCCDQNNAKFQPAVFAGSTNEASSNIPYVQLLTCVSENPSFNMTLPGGGLVYNAVSCPPNWAPVNEVSGRMLVALMDGGEPGASFGGSSIPPPSNFEPSARVQHKHLLNGTLTLPPAPTLLVEGCCANGYAKSGPYLYSSPSHDGRVDLPYTMLPLCQYVGSN